jgi:hypothetical protein
VEDLPEPYLGPEIETHPWQLFLLSSHKTWWELGFRRLCRAWPKKTLVQISSANISWSLGRDDENEQKEALPPGVEQARVLSPKEPSLPKSKGGTVSRTLKASEAPQRPLRWETALGRLNGL